MNDTSPEVEKLMRETMMSRSGEERFVMGAQMFDAARELIIASLTSRFACFRTQAETTQTYSRLSPAIHP